MRDLEGLARPVRQALEEQEDLGLTPWARETAGVERTILDSCQRLWGYANGVARAHARMADPFASAATIERRAYEAAREAWSDFMPGFSWPQAALDAAADREPPSRN